RPGGKRRGGGARPCPSPRLRGGIHQPPDGVSDVGRDARPVDVQAAAVVDVLQCPQVGVPFLQPPATPKFALAPLLMTNPPPVRKSHIQAFAAPLESASVAIPSTRRVQISRMNIPPLLNGRGGGPEDHV